MRYINNTIRNIAVLIAFIILAIAVFGLVSRQRESQTVTQVTTSPTVEVLSTPSPSSEKTPTPHEYGVTIGKGSFLTSEPLPPPTPTATFEPPTGRIIGGYSFSLPKIVPNTIGIGNKIAGWLPNSDKEILVKFAGNRVEVVNVENGTSKLYGQATYIPGDPVWIPEQQAVGYFAVNDDDPGKQQLWISDGSSTHFQTDIDPVFATTLYPPLTLAPDGSSLITFNDNWQLVKVNNSNHLQQQTATINLADTQEFIPTDSNQDQTYKVTSTSDNRKAIFYNSNHLLLASLDTGEVEELSLEIFTPGQNQILLQPHCVRWKPDTQKLVMIGQADSTSIRSPNYLYILNLETNEFQQISHSFLYIYDAIWSPDGKNLLVAASYDETEIKTSPTSDQPDLMRTTALFFVDIATGEIEPLGIPQTNAQFGECMMRWSPVETKIALGYFDFAEGVNAAALYTIDVNRP